MITIEIVESASVTDAFNRLIQAGTHMQPIMDSVGAELESRTSARFESQTDPDGVLWAALQSSTLKNYPKDGSRKPLNRTGDMLRSLTHQADDNSVLVGFGQPYAVFHEIGNMNMERRGMLTSEPTLGILGAGDKEAVLGVLSSALQSAWDGT